MKYRIYDIKRGRFITKEAGLDEISSSYDLLAEKEDYLILKIDEEGIKEEKFKEVNEEEDKWGFTAGVGGYE